MIYILIFNIVCIWFLTEAIEYILLDHFERKMKEVGIILTVAQRRDNDLQKIIFCTRVAFSKITEKYKPRLSL